MENLTRGLIASNVGNGMLVSWRLLGTDDPATEFNLYRDGTKIASIGKTDGTNYLDKDGKATSKYTVAAVAGGKEGGKSAAEIVFTDAKKEGNVNFPYKVLKLDVPASQKMPDGSTCTYTPNDMSVGDLDGDGQLDLVLKWDPSNAQDNSKDGYTGSVFVDGMKLDGTRLWRIDLGKNIRAGAHYTQFMVYDLDGDGIAEIVMKTSDGTVDGKGKVIGDASKDYRTSAGRIMSGNEFLTVFNGRTGEEVTTIDYWPKRNITNSWGDTYGNRSERMLAAVAYLDGVHPSVIMNRGYYTMAYLVAYDFDGKNLKERWKHTSDKSGQGLYGEGNHNLSVGDLDGDGKDEIVFGAAALNSDGTLRYRTGFGHGDAMHLSDMDPDNPGLELYDVHEDKQNKYSEEYRDKDGKVLWGTTQTEAGNVDNGRGMAADIDSTNRGFEMWSGTSKGARSVKGEVVTTTGLSQNFRIYFDGDLQDELMDATGSPTVENGGATGGKIEKYNSSKKTLDRLFSFYNVEGASLNNWTKANPCIVADLFGDWREEFIVRSGSDPSKVIIFTTPFTSPYRVYTLMHDSHYRVSIAWQNVAQLFFPEFCFDKLCESVQTLFFRFAVRAYFHGGAEWSRQHEDSHDAFCVHADAVFFHFDSAFEFFRCFNEKAGCTRMKTEFVCYRKFNFSHFDSLFSRSCFAPVIFCLELRMMPSTIVLMSESSSMCSRLYITIERFTPEITSTSSFLARESAMFEGLPPKISTKINTL